MNSQCVAEQLRKAYAKQLNIFWHYSSTTLRISASNKCNSFFQVINLSHAGQMNIHGRRDVIM